MGATTLPGGSEDTDYVVTKDHYQGYTDADDGETATLKIGALLGKDGYGASAVR